ncbi:MAG: hemolysin III family protein [Pseudomonadota bacterium]
MDNEPDTRTYSGHEIAADAVVHALGVGFALIAGPILIGLVAAEHKFGEITAISIYVASLIAMFSFSAIYNLVPLPAAREWFRRLDHSTIYLKIAGAYTPFAAISLGGKVGLVLLASVWGAAIIGIFLKIVFPRRYELFSLCLYLAMGWAAIIVAGDIAENVEVMTLMLMVTSGILYTLGVVFHVWRALPFQNAIWHVFVLVATAVMYSAIASEFV